MLVALPTLFVSNSELEVTMPNDEPVGGYSLSVIQNASVGDPRTSDPVALNVVDPAAMANRSGTPGQVR